MLLDSCALACLLEQEKRHVHFSQYTADLAAEGRLRDKPPMEHFTIKREMAIVCMQPFLFRCELADGSVRRAPKC